MNLSIDTVLESKKITEFIKQILTKTGAAGIVVACSGGVDSSTSLALVIEASGTANTHVLMLPYGDLSIGARKRALDYIEQLHLPRENVQTIDIAPVVTEASKIVGLGEKNTVRKGNIMARIRMILLYDYAKQHNLLVCGTENKSEYYLGYYTRFGDEASDIEPIRHLYKTQVYQLARYLNVPRGIIDQKPTAGLWKDQTDEGELGFSYHEADQVLNLYFDEKKAVEEIEKQFVNVRKIIAHAEKNRFKHEVPYTPDFE